MGTATEPNLEEIALKAQAEAITPPPALAARTRAAELADEAESEFSIYDNAEKASTLYREADALRRRGAFKVIMGGLNG